MRNRIVFALPLALILSLGAVGCGSEEPEAPAGGTSDGARLADFGAPGEGGELPPGHPPIDGSAGTLPPVDAGAGTGEAAVAWDAPASWESVPPSSGMRRAQYRIPGEGGDAELAVFYFGPGQGGDPQANAERWASQFAPEGGGSPTAAMKTERLDIAGRDVLMVTTKGTYMASPSMGGPAEPQSGWMLLGAIVEGPDANWFFKMTGPEATVEAQRDAFREMLGTIRAGE